MPKVQHLAPFLKVFSKKACNFSAIVLLLYPTRAGCWIHSIPRPCFSSCFYLLIIAISFIYLLIIYPACLKGQKSDDPPALGHRFSFCRLFCGQPGERLTDVAGEVEGPQRTHRAVAAQLHRAGDARRDVRRCLSLSAPGADVFCQRLSGHGAGRVGRDRDEPLCQRQQQCQHLVHILVGHDAASSPARGRCGWRCRGCSIPCPAAHGGP